MLVALVNRKIYVADHCALGMPGQSSEMGRGRAAPLLPAQVLATVKGTVAHAA